MFNLRARSGHVCSTFVRCLGIAHRGDGQASTEWKAGTDGMRAPLFMRVRAASPDRVRRLNDRDRGQLLERARSPSVSLASQSAPRDTPLVPKNGRT